MKICLRATRLLAQSAFEKMGHGVERDLCSFNIPPTVRTKLTRAGFRTSKDLDGVSVVELTKGDDDHPNQQRLPSLWHSLVRWQGAMRVSLVSS